MDRLDGADAPYVESEWRRLFVGAREDAEDPGRSSEAKGSEVAPEGRLALEGEFLGGCRGRFGKGELMNR